VGKRLALVALAKTYAKEITHSGPVFQDAKFADDLVKASFQHQGKLILREGSPSGFEVAGEDRQFFPASAKLEEEVVVISSPSVPHPVAVRYAFTNAPPATLSDSSNLPAAPFRTDDWPYVPPTAAKEVDLP